MMNSIRKTKNEQRNVFCEQYRLSKSKVTVTFGTCVSVTALGYHLVIFTLLPLKYHKFYTFWVLSMISIRNSECLDPRNR